MVGYLDFKPGLKTGSAPLQKSFPVNGSLGGPPHDAKWSALLEIRGVNSSLKFIFFVFCQNPPFSGYKITLYVDSITYVFFF